MRPSSAVLPVAAALALATVTVGHAEPAAYQVSSTHPQVSWRGSLTGPAPLGCYKPNLGCESQHVRVTAKRGTWITARLTGGADAIWVSHGADSVGVGGFTNDPDLSREGEYDASRVVVFRQVAAGTVDYEVAVGSAGAAPGNSAPYKVQVKLAGKEFDRQLPCTLANADGLQDKVTGRTHELRVRLVGAPADSNAIRAAGRTLTQIYGRIGVPVRVSYDFFPVRMAKGDDYPFQVVRRHYGGQRPSGVDVVDVLTDQWAGGFASCIGGIRYEDRAFAVSQLHYTTPAGPSVRDVPAGLLAAHEIGHLLGAQHNQVSCVEAIPQQIRQPADDGYVGPCTVMGPLALQDSEVFSTLERNTIRDYVDRYAGP